LPSGSTGTSYSQTLSASGGMQPYSWSLASGGLPPGLTLSAGGVISGVPTSAGTFNFTVRVTDSSAAIATQSFALVIASGLTISSNSPLPSGSTGTSYSQTLSASGGMQPYSWALASGGLPPGLTLSGGGLISGTPTSAGTFNFTVRVTDSSAATATQVFILSVSDALAITTASLPPVKVGTVYSQTLAATGGHPPYTWSLRTGALATGLSLSSLGTISGTPANSGTFPFTVQVADSTSVIATQALSIVVTLTNAVSSVSAATYAALLAPESIAAAFGTDLATSAMPVTTLPLPTSFNGTTVKVKDSAGVERLAPLFYVGPTQVNYEIPTGTATGQATITITSGDGTVSTGNIKLTSVAPALFSANGDGQGPAAAVAIHAKPGGVQTHEFLAVLDSTSHKFVVSAIDLGPANEQVFVLLYGSGIRGRTSLANVTATIGDVPVPVAYAGAQVTFAGLDQINLGPMPRSLIGAGVVNIILTVDSQAANTLQMDIK